MSPEDEIELLPGARTNHLEGTIEERVIHDALLSKGRCCSSMAAGVSIISAASAVTPGVLRNPRPPYRDASGWADRPYDRTLWLIVHETTATIVSLTGHFAPMSVTTKTILAKPRGP